jgi:hypothetical protein
MCLQPVAVWPRNLLAVVAISTTNLARPAVETFAEPAHVDEVVCRSRGARAMPDLGRLVLRTDALLHAGGDVIKGMYYGRSSDGPNDLVAFRLGCAGVLDPRPFLVFKFAAGAFLLDADRDGCADGAGVLSNEIDPADFLPALTGSWPGCAPTS